jgi:hypothetical protein
MSPQELEKTRRRLGGGTTPNASGARQQEAPAILAGSEPSRELTSPALTPEEIAATAQANKAARGVQVANEDAVHEAALSDEFDETPQENTHE